MFKLPDNIYYKIFDLSFKGSTHRYVPKEDSYPIELAQKNIDLIKQSTNANEILFLNQVHGATNHYSTQGSIVGKEAEADGSLTDTPGLLLAIQTADCVPVLIYANNGSIIGAAHCGWRGAKLNILKDLHKNLSTKAKDFSAIVGPSIHQKSYEVDNNFLHNFLTEDKKNERFFINSKRPDYFMFDVPGYVISKIEKLNFTNIHHINEDTYTAKLSDGSFKYPSYRRSCHTGEIYPRSLVSTIMIKKL